jgi:hypothetical protein
LEIIVVFICNGGLVGTVTTMRDFCAEGLFSKLQIVQPCFGDGGANADIIKF